MVKKYIICERQMFGDSWKEVMKFDTKEEAENAVIDWTSKEPWGCYEIKEVWCGHNFR